jgi:AraC-like DNA-binding protein
VEARPEYVTTRPWLERAIQRFQLAAEVRPGSCSDLYDLLADVADSIPPPSTYLDTVCARYLLQCACIRLATPLGGVPNGVEASPAWTSVWGALRLINSEHWTKVPAGLHALGERHRRLQSLPNRVQAHLKVHFPQPCRLKEIARNAGASIRVMTDAFKREHGCTIHQYVSLLRLREAVRLLIESDLKIAAICESVGWYSQADFYRHLRRFAPVSPGAARLDKSSALIVLHQLDEWLGSRGLTA